MIVLDSTILIDLFQGNYVARRFMDYITSTFPEEEVVTTAVNYYEVFLGINHRRSTKEEIFFREFFSNIDVINLDQSAAEEASRIMALLLKKGRPAKALDVLIAGIAKTNGATKLVARDIHFECISDVVKFKILVYDSEPK
jgi:tRNA(fMet)-specific endonuclease VapC